MHTLSIIVPVYFNADTLTELFQSIQLVENKLTTMGFYTELIFVDDGSEDQSLLALRDIKKIRPSTKIIKLSRNFGAIQACKCGLNFVTGDCFTLLAADLQDPPELIVKMAEKWLEGHKFIICERESREDPFISKFFTKIYYFLLRNLVVAKYPKGGFDLALMDKSMLPHLLNSSKNLHASLLSYWLGYPPYVIPYYRRKRVHGKSKWTLGKKVKSFLDVIFGFSIKPIRLMSGIGLSVALLSFIFGVSVVIGAIKGNIPIAGFATVTSLICFLLGLMLLMLGMIGEYLWRVLEEVNKRPEFVIDEILE